MMRRARTAALLLPAALIAACGDPPARGTRDAGGAPGPGGDEADLRAPYIPYDLAGLDLAEPFMGAVYAHSQGDLYEIDPNKLTVTKVGPFSVTNGATEDITDIALDRDGQMYGISFNSIFSIDKATAKAKRLAGLPQQFNGLSFVPPDQIDQGGGQDEILVATANSGDLYQVNPKTGAATRIGSYGGPSSSGDLVAVTGLGAIATVKTGGIFDFGNDQLARIDFRSGGKATIIGDTGFRDIWGIGFWADKVYGFTDGGDFITIDVKTGKGRKVKNQGIAWWGAGVTTIAPVTIQ